MRPIYHWYLSTRKESKLRDKSYKFIQRFRFLLLIKRISAMSKLSLPLTVILIDHFTVVYSVIWPLNGSEAGGDLALIQTSLP